METNPSPVVPSHTFRFKSYYVVWKPRYEEKNKRNGRTFKSYYVVWKLWAHEGIEFPPHCLNRTM